MTKTQIKFYNIIIKQIVDYEEIFHKDFIKSRIAKIPDEKLKFLLEDINIDKDNILKRKGYITYAKFLYYADKMIDNLIAQNTKIYSSKVEQLYKKREILLKTISDVTKTISERNKLIDDLEKRLIMFKDNGKNILDKIDYFIIEQFGFYRFFDENRNYMIKEDIERYLKLYSSISLEQPKLLSNNSKGLHYR